MPSPGISCGEHCLWIDSQEIKAKVLCAFTGLVATALFCHSWESTCTWFQGLRINSETHLRFRVTALFLVWMDSPSCAVCSALALLHPSIVSLAERAWSDFGSAAVAQGDLANIPCCSKAARHKGQLLSGTQMRQKQWACPSALSWPGLLSGCQLKELGAASAAAAARVPAVL